MTASARTRHHQAQKLGLWAERLCVWLLRLKGYSVLQQGLVIGRGTGAGQIDIIARRGAVLVFIEVKARRSHDEAAHAISTAQKQRLTRAAEVFLARNPAFANCAVRFDAMLVAPGRFPLHITDAWREPS